MYYDKLCKDNVLSILTKNQGGFKMTILEIFDNVNKIRENYTQELKDINKIKLQELREELKTDKEKDEFAIFEFCKMVYEKNEDYEKFSRLTDDDRELYYHLFKLIGYKGFYIENIGGSVRVVADYPKREDYWLVYCEYKITEDSNYKLITSKLIEALNE